MEGEGRVVYKDQVMKVTLLNDEEAAKYRKIPVGLTQNATVIRSVAEHDGVKSILEITADGFRRTKVKV